MYELIDAFKPEERVRVADIIFDYNLSKDQHSFLVDQIGRLQELIECGKADQYQKNLILVFKFLFRRKCQWAQSKIKTSKYDDTSLKKLCEEYLKDEYEDQVAAFRQKIHDLMMNDGFANLIAPFQNLSE